MLKWATDRKFITPDEAQKATKKFGNYLKYVGKVNDDPTALFTLVLKKEEEIRQVNFQLIIVQTPFYLMRNYLKKRSKDMLMRIKRNLINTPIV